MKKERALLEQRRDANVPKRAVRYQHKGQKVSFPQPTHFVTYLDAKKMEHLALVLKTYDDGSLLVRVFRCAAPNQDVVARPDQWRKRGK